MTEYGRGQGSQPWHPEDPLYGDQGWDGTQQPGWDTYGGQPQPGHYEVNQPNQQDTGGWQQTGGYQGGYAQHQGQPQGGHGQYHQDPYGQGQFAHGQYANNGQHPQYQHDPYGHGGPYDSGQYDTGQYSRGPYDGPQAYPGSTDHYGQQPGYEHYQGQPDPYTTQDAYPPPRPQHDRRPEPEPAVDWDSDAHLEDHAFFANDTSATRRRGREPYDGHGPDGPDTRRDPDDPDRLDDLDDPDDEVSRGGRRGKGGPRRKNGMACLLVAAVLVGGIGGAGYFGYQYYQSRFSSAPDFEGQGSGEVQVEIPANSSLSDMGNILRRAGVVKSHDSFVEASRENEKAQEIHAGSYILRKEMSASAAIELMLDPASQGGLIIPEGLRATRIYEMIDKKTESTKGTTEKVAEDADLGLPAWADGEAEGFLFPSKYSVSEKSDPEDVLKEMVKRSKAEFKKIGFEDNAKKVNHSPREVLTIASLIQAEAQSDDEFGKVSQVVYNRLKPGNSATNGRLDFDSTINYALGRSTLDVTVNDTKLDHPYNTYRHAGLPPGPIDNPGHQAIEAALKPTKGDWLYFVTVRPGDTRFSDTFEEHSKHVREFNEEQRKNREESD